ncbi:MAG: DUF484 family protein [Gammaproteobacteria bacterium]
MNEHISDLTSVQVEHYLLHHPEFFNEHLHLLEKMVIPHPSGSAISLISKQLEIFRCKHHELENQLNALIEIARDNDTSFNRMHKLTLALLDAASLAEIADKLEQILFEYFLTDFVAIRIIRQSPAAGLEALCIEPDSETLEPFISELSTKEPKCGRLTLAQARVLFGESALEVKSGAIIPLTLQDDKGLLAIGSKQKDRFHYSMGSLFLNQMGEIISARLISLMPRN